MSRRRVAIAFLIALGVVVLAFGAAVGARYYRYRRSQHLVRQARRALDDLADEGVRRDLKAHAAYLAGRIDRGWLADRKDFFLGRLHREAVGLRDAALGRVARPHHLPGHHVIVTVSEVDGAEMPTSLMVPEGWDGSDPLPLVLYLHGGGVRGMRQCFPAPSCPGALVMEPVARGSHDYVGVQMTAVEECLADVRRRFPVGALYVMGTSMGGLATWFFAERHLAQVDGISPWSANADPDAWKGLWEDERLIRSPAGRACELANRARSPVARAEQLASRPDLPIWVGHGDADNIVPVGHAISMVEKLRGFGAANVRFDRFPDLGHGLPGLTAERIAWLMAHAPRSEPDQMVAAIPPLTFVADLAGAPPHRVVDPLEPARLIVRAGRVEGGTNVAASEGRGPSKWHYPGPAAYAFDHPFSFDLPPDAPEHLALCADDFASLWKRRYGGDPRRSDENAGLAAFPGDATGPRSLVALGSPEENPAVRAALEGLDVAVGPGRARLFGQEFEGQDIGLILLRPHPTDLRAATLVVWGSTPASYGQLWLRFGHAVNWEGDRGRWWFDYAVFDRKTCGPDSFLAAGYFGHDWRFEPSLLFRGSEELRAEIPGSNWAIAAAEPGQERVWLSSLAPEAIEAPRGSLGFDRSAGMDAGALMIQGERFAHGLGMIPPAKAQWRLDGRFAGFRARVGLERTGAAHPVRYAAERVRFEVWADGEKVAESPVLSATDGLAELSADLDGVEMLELRAVNTTPHVWHYGPVGWGDAELVRQP